MYSQNYIAKKKVPMISCPISFSIFVILFPSDNYKTQHWIFSDFLMGPYFHRPCHVIVKV